MDNSKIELQIEEITSSFSTLAIDEAKIIKIQNGLEDVF